MLLYAMLCYVMLCYCMLCYAMLCYIILCYVMLLYAMLCYVMLYYVMLLYDMLCYIILYYVMLCYCILCYAMLCYVILCYCMLCYAMLYYIIKTLKCRRLSGAINVTWSFWKFRVYPVQINIRLLCYAYHRSCQNISLWPTQFDTPRFSRIRTPDSSATNTPSVKMLCPNSKMLLLVFS